VNLTPLQYVETAAKRLDASFKERISVTNRARQMRFGPYLWRMIRPSPSLLIFT
jgi:hypothetical protein